MTTFGGGDNKKTPATARLLSAQPSSHLSTPSVLPVHPSCFGVPEPHLVLGSRDGNSSARSATDHPLQPGRFPLRSVPKSQIASFL